MAILVKGQILMYATTNILKLASQELRPDGTYRSLFSGICNSYLFKTRIKGPASVDAICGLHHSGYNQASSHCKQLPLFEDVLFGDGLGLLSMKVAYWTHRYKWGKNKRRELSSLSY